MTIIYQSEVATGSFSGFAKLLFKWRGSIYKLVYKELLLFSVAYAIISFIYRYCLNDSKRLQFESVTIYCANYIEMIPLSFVLGFYVTYVVQRWWTQFITIPFPDKLMNLVTMYVGGTDERGRIIRRTLMRYWNLSFVLLMSSISVAVKKRFPTTRHLVEAGFMTHEELRIYESVQVKINKFWIAHTWFIKLLDQARIEGRLREGAPIKHILEELNESRNNLRILWCHDWVTVPLVYTQVVTWATHLFFLISLIGRQYLDPSKNYKGQEIDLYVPFFTIIQFLFYMGWLKVAEQLINPFGEDDDDVECNWLIDRHLQVSYLGVDELNVKVPTLQKDMYWDERQPEVPYTEATMVHKIPSYTGSTTNIVVPIKRQTLIRRRTVARKTDNSTSPENGQPPQTIIDEPLTPTNVEPEVYNKKNSRGFHFFNKILTPGGFSSNGHHTSPSTPSSDTEKSAQLAQRTLGRRETLMGDHILALINTGRWTAAPSITATVPLGQPPPQSRSNGTSDHQVIDMDRKQPRPPGRSSRKFGRFLPSRRSSTASQQSFGSISSLASSVDLDAANSSPSRDHQRNHAYVNGGFVTELTEMPEHEAEALADIFADAQKRGSVSNGSTSGLMNDGDDSSSNLMGLSRLKYNYEEEEKISVNGLNRGHMSCRRLSEADEDVCETTASATTNVVKELE